MLPAASAVIPLRRRRSSGKRGEGCRRTTYPRCGRKRDQGKGNQRGEKCNVQAFHQFLHYGVEIVVPCTAADMCATHRGERMSWARRVSEPCSRCNSRLTCGSWLFLRRFGAPARSTGAASSRTVELRPDQGQGMASPCGDAVGRRTTSQQDSTKEKKVKKPTLMIVAAALVALGVAAGPAMAQKKDARGGGEGPGQPVLHRARETDARCGTRRIRTRQYTCLYTGPASSADEAGEVQIVEDLINKGVAGIAISPSNAPAMANMLKAKKPKMPIMTIDADLAAADRALRKTYLGTNNYDMGVLMAKHLKGSSPKGGTVCLQLGNVAADNINARAAGFRDTIGGKKGIDRLKGEGGWTEIAGCPLFTNDQIDLANQQMSDVFTKNPKLDAFILVGGWAQFGPQAYAQVTDQVMAKAEGEAADHHCRRHAAAAARRAESGPQPRADRPAPVRDGPPRARGADRPDQGQEGRRPALHGSRRVHARLTWASARRSSAASRNVLRGVGRRPCFVCPASA